MSLFWITERMGWRVIRLDLESYIHVRAIQSLMFVCSNRHDKYALFYSDCFSKNCHQKHFNLIFFFILTKLLLLICSTYQIYLNIFYTFIVEDNKIGFEIISISLNYSASWTTTDIGIEWFHLTTKLWRIQTMNTKHIKLLCHTDEGPA